MLWSVHFKTTYSDIKGCIKMEEYYICIKIRRVVSLIIGGLKMEASSKLKEYYCRGEMRNNGSIVISISLLAFTCSVPLQYFASRNIIMDSTCLSRVELGRPGGSF